jgi:hypothetical protein
MTCGVHGIYLKFGSFNGIDPIVPFLYMGDDLYCLYFLSITDRLFQPSRFEKYLAAEALRINENDADKALDLLTNPEQNCILQVCLLCTPVVLLLVTSYSTVANTLCLIAE